MQSWYLGMKPDKINYYPSALPAQIPFKTGDPKREFVEHVVDRHLLPAAGITLDPINYLRAGEGYPKLPDRYETVEDYLRAFRSLAQPGTPFARLVNDHNANLAYLRVRLKDGTDVAGSMVVNRWHDNVAFLIKEDARLDPARDSVDFVKGLIGSYPNYFFDVREEDLPDFLDLLGHFELNQKDLARLAKYGIDRADDRLWETYDWFQQRLNADEPVSGGLFDLNRYYYTAR
jgi:hypothetical protein